jgi:hypothetical protein
MNRFLIQISATMIVDTNYSADDIAVGIAARLEEIAQSSEHLLDYEVLPYLLPKTNESSHQRNRTSQS